MQSPPLKKAPADLVLRDLKRDWEGWSPWERRAVLTLAAASFVASLFWLGMSINLLW